MSDSENNNRGLQNNKKLVKKSEKRRFIFTDTDTDTDTEDLFLSIMNTAKDPLVILDATFSVRVGNVSFYREFQVNPEETDGRLIFDIGNRQWDIPELHTLLEELLPNKKSFDDFEVNQEFPSIGRRIMLVNARQVIGPPPVKEKLILLGIDDITQRKLLEEQRDQALKAREELVAVVSHELKNPLTTITSSLDLMKRVMPSDKYSEKMLKLFHNIYEATRRMARITSDLIDVSKIGHFPLELAPIEVSLLVDEVVTLSQPLALDKSIRIEKNISKEVSVVICDRDRIVQSLLNLLNNAIKFTAEGGTIRVEVDRVDDQIRFKIRDTGCGISKDQLPHVFERFWQAKHRQYLGSGLGLYITKGIVQMHGGKVGVESKSGEGSLFYFTLPIASAALVQKSA